MKDKYSMIQAKFTYILDELEQISEQKYNLFSEILNSIKGTELMNGIYTLVKTKLHALLAQFDELGGFGYKRRAISDLVESIEGTNLMDSAYSLIESHFINVLTLYDEYDYTPKLDAFPEIITKIKGTKLMYKNYSLIEIRVIDLLEHIPHIKGYLTKDDYRFFSNLYESMKGTRLMDNNYELIKKKFFELLNQIELKFYREGVSLFLSMLRLINGTKLMRECFPEIKDADLNNYYTIRKWMEKYYS